MLECNLWHPQLPSFAQRDAIEKFHESREGAEYREKLEQWRADRAAEDERQSEAAEEAERLIAEMEQAAKNSPTEVRK